MKVNLWLHGIYVDVYVCVCACVGYSGNVEKSSPEKAASRTGNASIVLGEMNRSYLIKERSEKCTGLRS